MKTAYSPLHERHDPEKEFYRGLLVDCFERPRRALGILRELGRRELGEVIELDAEIPAGDSGTTESGIIEPSSTIFGSRLLPLIEHVHGREYVDFVETIFRDWARETHLAGVPRPSYALPYTFNRLGQDHDETGEVVPGTVDGRLGYFSFDTCTPITAGTWHAALGSAWCAVKGQEIVLADGAAFALCRPPGHHAHRQMCGGYCFFNNAAIAAEAFRQHEPSARIAILDVDYHHGNGTQSIFYDRDDVFVVSIHADPLTNYPYYLGHSNERGGPNAPESNANLPLPDGTDWNGYAPTLQRALDMIRERDPSHLIVSLGVDTFVGDQISNFRLTSPDFFELGALIGEREWDTLFVMEGGYHDEIGVNVVNVLEGFERGGGARG